MNANLRKTILAAAASLLFVPAAWAFHPPVSEMRTVRTLAHRIDDLAARIHDGAEAQRHHFTWREERALRRLHQLDDAAAHFHAQVERYWQDPAHTEADYYALKRAYMRAAWAMHDLHAYSGGLYRDFARLEGLMWRLSVTFEQPYEYRDRGHHGGPPWSRGYGPPHR